MTCIHVYIEDEVGRKYLFESFDGVSIKALMWNDHGHIFNIEKKLLVGDLAEEPFSGTYYYHAHALEFNKTSEITKTNETLFKLRSNIANYKFSREKYLYRKKKQELKDSVTILSTIVDIYLENKGEYCVNEYEILEKLF